MLGDHATFGTAVLESSVITRIPRANVPGSRESWVRAYDDGDHAIPETPEAPSEDNETGRPAGTLPRTAALYAWLGADRVGGKGSAGGSRPGIMEP